MSALWQVQKSIYNALSADSTFMGLISSRLKDEPDANQDYPYVVIGDGLEIPANRLNNVGYEVYIDIVVYTKPYGLGWYPAKSIMNSMNTVLNFKSLSMTGFYMVNCQYDGSDMVREGELRILTARYKVLVH